MLSPTVQAKLGPPLVWAMTTPLPSVLLVTLVMVTLRGTLSLTAALRPKRGPLLVKVRV